MANLLFIPLILIVGYLLLIRPQQQRVRRQQQLLSSISEGDQVITAGGLVGRVATLHDDKVEVEIAPGTTVVFLRQAISGRVDEPGESPATFDPDGARDAHTMNGDQPDSGADHEERVDGDHGGGRPEDGH